MWLFSRPVIIPLAVSQLEEINELSQSGITLPNGNMVLTNPLITTGTWMHSRWVGNPVSRNRICSAVRRCWWWLLTWSLPPPRLQALKSVKQVYRRKRTQSKPSYVSKHEIWIYQLPSLHHLTTHNSEITMAHPSLLPKDLRTCVLWELCPLMRTQHQATQNQARTLAHANQG